MFRALQALDLRVAVQNPALSAGIDFPCHAQTLPPPRADDRSRLLGPVANCKWTKKSEGCVRAVDPEVRECGLKPNTVPPGSVGSRGF